MGDKRWLVYGTVYVSVPVEIEVEQDPDTMSIRQRKRLVEAMEEEALSNRDRLDLAEAETVEIEDWEEIDSEGSENENG